MDRTKPAWQYIGEMREGVVWFDRNPHAFPLGTRYYALSGDATDMAAEIERMRPLADEVQAARHVMREHNRLLVELAASQAREQQLQEAVRQNHEWHNNYDEYGGYPESELAEVNEQAIALPQDTSALEAIVARAGEVMRERCAHEADPFELKNALATDIAKGIRALPGVKLEDLQK